MLTEELISYAYSCGASLAGVADLSALPEENRESLPFGVSLGIVLSTAVLKDITGGPTASYYAEYKAVNERLAGLAGSVRDFLAAHGFKAVGGKPTISVDNDLSTRLPHKTVATRAGLGWIGKSALLVTPGYGSAVRLITVLTDAPLEAAVPVDVSRCGVCTACVDACPAGALTGEQWQPGIPREALFDAHACRRTTSELSFKAFGERAFICGRCIVACPFTQRYLSMHHD